LIVAVVVPLVGRPIARARARRYGDRVRRKLRDAATGVARESVAPARAVLRDYDDARVALREAGGSVDRSAEDQERPIHVT